MSKVLFPLGQLVATPGALDALRGADQGPAQLLRRHQTGDWGTLSAEDAAENVRAIANGTRILSAYPLATGVKIWVITESDRSSTCLLLPDEY